MSCVSEKELFGKPLMQVSTDLLMWIDAHMQSSAKIHHVAVLTGKFLNFSVLYVFLRCFQSS